ncbi:MAG: response regulator [Ignavibacteriales bacterium]|nr:response regulator [Ignavibacteriales bacterium]
MGHGGLNVPGNLRNNLASANKPKLLIAEDDFENQKFLELYLRRFFDVNICDSSEVFCTLLEKDDYDIILMDISIKGSKNGLELTKELKSNPVYSHIPVICYTAHAFNRDRNNALNAGCDAYVSKPSDVRTLLNSLFELLKATKKNLSLEELEIKLALSA